MVSRRIIPLLLLCLITAAGLPGLAEAGWVWTPQTGWIGPSGAVKDTPQEQLSYAMELFQQGNFPKARIEFQKLVKKFKNAREAADAQYYLGRCRESEGDYYTAFVAYRKTLQTYPSSARFEEILERMTQIGNYFLSGKKRKAFGGAALLPAQDKAVEIFKSIVEEGPFSQQGELAQYKLGLAHLAMGEYEDAVRAFQQLIEHYPDSPLVDDARFQITQASLKGTFKPEYDQYPTEQAVSQLQTFVKDFPQSELAPEASTRTKQLQERRAEHDFQAAQFYDKQKLHDSALVYYRGVVADYPQTSWAAKAAQRIQAMEGK